MDGGSGGMVEEPGGRVKAVKDTPRIKAIRSRRLTILEKSVFD